MGTCGYRTGKCPAEIKLQTYHSICIYMGQQHTQINGKVSLKNKQFKFLFLCLENYVQTAELNLVDFMELHHFNAVPVVMYFAPAAQKVWVQYENV